MSADNYGNCPKCKKNAEEKGASLYGKVSESEYIAYMKKIKQTKYMLTLREDYEIYTTEDGEFIVRYGCSCPECGFEFNYDHKESLEI